MLGLRFACRYRGCPVGFRPVWAIRSVPKLCRTYSSTVESVISAEVAPEIASPVPKRALRPYQEECIQRCVDTLKRGESKRLAISIATGGGKTFVFTKLIPQLIGIPNGTPAKGILILVHRKELAEQAMQSIRACPELEGCPMFLEMAKHKVTEEQLEALRGKLFIVVASVPTLARSADRLEKFDPSLFQAVIVDECHHAVSGSYTKILEHFGCEDGGSPDAPFLLGFSATLQRHDGKPLKKIFDEIVYEKSMLELVDEGYLVDCDWRVVHAGFKLDTVDIGWDGDYRVDSLARHVDTPEINDLTLKTYKHFAKERGLKSTLIFCCNVQHIENLSALFRANGINAQYVSGNTPILERSSIIEDFKQGKVEVLLNCGIFTEGTDLPNIDSILLVRPTKSQPLLTQMVGRGLRLHEDKEKCLIVDFVESNDTGLTLQGTLGGTVLQNPIGTLFAVDNGRGLLGYETPLEKQPDYVEFKTFEGFKELVKEWQEDGDDGVPMHVKVRRALAQERLGDVWVQTKKDSWAMRLDGSHYYRMDLVKRKLVLSYVYLAMKLIDSGRRPIQIPKSKEVGADSDPAEVLALLSRDVCNNETRGELYDTAIASLSHQRGHPITERQLQFLLKSFNATINPSKHCRLDVGKFSNAVEASLSRMNRAEASNLIFAYTVTRRKALQVWASSNVLNTKEKRSDLLKEETPAASAD